MATATESSAVTIPVTPSSTTSLALPASVVTLGIPAIAASMRVTGMPSLSEVRTAKSAAAKRSPMSDCHPRNRTDEPKGAARRSVSASRPPSPATARTTLGWRSRTSRIASIRRSGRLIAVNRPTKSATGTSVGKPSRLRAKVWSTHSGVSTPGGITMYWPGRPILALTRSSRTCSPTATNTVVPRASTRSINFDNPETTRPK